MYYILWSFFCLCSSHKDSMSFYLVRWKIVKQKPNKNSGCMNGQEYFISFLLFTKQIFPECLLQCWNLHQALGQTMSKVIPLSSRNGEARTGYRQEIGPLSFRPVKGYDRKQVHQGSTKKVSTSVLGCQLAPQFSFLLDSF